MKNRIAIWIAVCFVTSICVVVVLLAASKDIRQRPGSFLRNFPPHPALEVNVLDLKYNSYYIAGGTSHHIYLANYAVPLHMLIVNHTLTHVQQVELDVKDIEKEKFWAIRIRVDSPYYYLTDGAVPVIYRGTVHKWKAERYEYDRAFFQDIVPITHSSFFIRSLGKPVKENVLGKLMTDTPHVKMKPGILQKQVDGIFCTDGMMHYAKQRHEFFYLYRYRNEYVVLDTSLNMLRFGHTIDTISRANIKTGHLKSSNQTTLSSPARMVNKFSCISNNLLFVNSTMSAKNEHRNLHDDRSVLDVYELAGGQYKFSFYIYDYQQREKLRMFYIFGNKLYALFEEHLQVWNLQENYFNNQVD